MNRTMPTKWITISERVYRMLLVLYPVEYRNEYGAPMVQVFRDVLRDRYRGQGIVGVMLWWGKTLLDLALTVMEQRRKVKSTMSKSTFTQLTGIFLILGGVFSALAAFSQLQPGSHNTYHGIYQFLVLLIVPAFLLFALGWVGVARRYDHALGTVGQWTLYLSSISALVAIVAGTASMLGANLWEVAGGGYILNLVGLIVFGVLHLRKPALPIFRALPLQIATGWLFVVMDSFYPQTLSNVLAFLMFLGFGLAWLAIGLTVHRQSEEPELAAA